MSEDAFTIWDGFPRYEAYETRVPVWCITPDTYGCIHRFFDTSPISPSGRYVGLTHLRDETRAPSPADAADVVVVDLHTGETKIVAETQGFGTQLGAQVQWGSSDEELYFNDVDRKSWRPFAICMNPLTGERRELEGPVYMVSPDGKLLASPCLMRTEMTQGGYGVIAPPNLVPLNQLADPDDGVFVTDTQTGKCKLLVSLKEIAEAIGDKFPLSEFGPGAMYGFHVKWNPQQTRLMFVVRFRPAAGRFHFRIPITFLTMKVDGTDIHVGMSEELMKKGGHHPNWCPDGELITQNLKLDSKEQQFVRYRYDGSQLKVLTRKIVGSGHPTLHPNGRHILTDVYAHEPLAFGDGTTPLRWVDLKEETEEHLVRIRTDPDTSGPISVLRVDPHPAWDRTFRRVVFNACPTGKRQVFVADLSSLV